MCREILELVLASLDILSIRACSGAVMVYVLHDSKLIYQPKFSCVVNYRVNVFRTMLFSWSPSSLGPFLLSVMNLPKEHRLVWVSLNYVILILRSSYIFLLLQTRVCTNLGCAYLWGNCTGQYLRK